MPAIVELATSTRCFYARGRHIFASKLRLRCWGLAFASQECPYTLSFFADFLEQRSIRKCKPLDGITKKNSWNGMGTNLVFDFSPDLFQWFFLGLAQWQSLGDRIPFWDQRSFFLFRQMENPSRSLLQWFRIVYHVRIFFSDQFRIFTGWLDMSEVWIGCLGDEVGCPKTTLVVVLFWGWPPLRRKRAVAAPGVLTKLEAVALITEAALGDRLHCSLAFEAKETKKSLLKGIGPQWLICWLTFCIAQSFHFDVDFWVH